MISALGFQVTQIFHESRSGLYIPYPNRFFICKKQPLAVRSEAVKFLLPKVRAIFSMYFPHRSLKYA